MPSLWDVARAEAESQGVDPEFVLRVMDAESGGNPRAVSSAGAIGPMQLMPGTARDLGVDPHDPHQNIRGGVRYLKQQLDEFGTQELAAAAYNAGPGRVRRLGRVPRIKETMNYVAKVARDQQQAHYQQADFDGSAIFGDGAVGGGEAGMPPGYNDSDFDGADIFAEGGAPETPAGPQAATPEGNTLGVLNAETGLPTYNQAQAEAVRAVENELIFADGKAYFRGLPIEAQTEAGVIPTTPGQYYFNLHGDILQVPGLARDVAQSAVTGVRRAAAGLAGLPGDIREANSGAANWIAGKMGQERSPEADAARSAAADATLGAMPIVGPLLAQGPSSGDVQRTEEELFGMRHVPQSLPAKFAASVGEQVPNAVMPGSAAARVASVVMPGLLSEGAGQLTEGKPYEPAARIAGAMVGGAVTPRAASILDPGEPTRRIQQGLHPALRHVETMGIELGPDAQSGRLMQGVHANVRAGIHPEDAAVMAAAETLPVPVPLARGHITNSAAEQLEDNLALRGAKGPGAERVAQQARQARQQALRENVDAIADRIGGGRTPQPGQGGAEVSGALNERFDEARAQVNRNYDAARDAPPAILPAYDGQALVGGMTTALSDFDPLKVPHVYREVERIIQAGGRQGDLDLRTLYDARSRLTALRASTDSVEATAAARAVRHFDGFMSDAVAADLLTGNAAGVERWRTAIGSRRDFGQLFQGDDLIQRLTERAPRGGEMQLKVDPGDAINYIFGRAGLGFVGKQNLNRDLERLRGVLGADSSEWNALRSEAFARFARSAEGEVDGGVRQFSGVKFLKAWEDANASNPRLVGTLFSADDRQLINQFARVAARLGGVKGGDNPSNSSVGMAALMKKMALAPWNLGKATPFISQGLTMIEDSINTARTARSVSGAAGRRVTPPAFSVRPGVTAGAIEAQTERQPSLMDERVPN